MVRTTLPSSLRWMTLLVAIAVSHGARAQQPPVSVAYAGIAFAGDETSIARRFPVTSSLVKDARAKDGGTGLDAVLLAKLRRTPNPSFTLVSGSLASLQGVDAALAFALVIDGETSSVEAIAGTNKLVAGLSAQLLFFDYKQMSVVAGYPVTVEYIDVLKTPPDEQRRAATLARLFDGDLGVSLLDDAVKSASRVRLHRAIGARLQVRNVTMAPRAQAVMPGGAQADAAPVQDALAQEFGKYLCTNAGISMLPHAKGYAIGNKMAMCFADGSVFSLTIPEPDYVIDLELQGFKKVESAKSEAGSTWVYGAFLRVILTEPLSGRVYMDLALKNGEAKVIPASQTTVDDWAAFRESLLLLMDKTAAALAAPTADWAARHAGGAAALPQLQAASKVVKSCN